MKAVRDRNQFVYALVGVCAFFAPQALATNEASTCQSTSTLWGMFFGLQVLIAGVAGGVYWSRQKRNKSKAKESKKLFDLNEELVKRIDETEKSLRSVFNSTFEGILIHDRGIILDANQSALHMLKIDFQELMGTEFLDFVEFESREKVENIIHANMVSRKTTTIRSKEGKLLTVELTCRPHTFRGHPVRLIAIRDMTVHAEKFSAKFEKLKNLKTG